MPVSCRRSALEMVRSLSWALQLKDSFFDHSIILTTPYRLNVMNMPASLSKLSVCSECLVLAQEVVLGPCVREEM